MSCSAGLGQVHYTSTQLDIQFFRHKKRNNFKTVFPRLYPSIQAATTPGFWQKQNSFITTAFAPLFFVPAAKSLYMNSTKQLIDQNKQ